MQVGFASRPQDEALAFCVFSMIWVVLIDVQGIWEGLGLEANSVSSPVCGQLLSILPIDKVLCVYLAPWLICTHL